MPEAQAGRKGRCPACRGQVTVPQVSAHEPTSTEDIQLVPVDAARLHDEAPSKPPDDRKLAEKLEEAQVREQQLLQSLGIELAPQHTGERKWPWPIDIWLYPTSGTGLTVLALLIGFPFLLRLLQFIAGPQSLHFFGLPIFLIAFMVGLYIGWYMAECVYDSAKGGTRAPSALPVGLGTGELWSRVSYLLAVCIIYLLPVVLYRMLFGKLDAIFWALAAWAILFFPMGLLAMVMHDSVSALNPLFLLGSILRTFFQYIGLIVLFLPFAGAFWLSGRTPEDAEPSVLLDVVGLVMTSYIPFILAHILGRFYWRYRDRLDWGI
jgi:hypothetical protein